MFLGGTINELSPKNGNKNAQKSANFAETMGFKSSSEYNGDMYLAAPKSIKYEINLTMKSSFWVEQLTNYHL